MRAKVFDVTNKTPDEVESLSIDQEHWLRTDIFFTYCIQGYENPRQKKLRNIPRHDGHIVAFLPIVDTAPVCLKINMAVMSAFETGEFKKSTWSGKDEPVYEDRKVSISHDYHAYDNALWTMRDMANIRHNFGRHRGEDFAKYPAIEHNYEFIDEKIKPTEVGDWTGTSEYYAFENRFQSSASIEEWLKKISEWANDTIIIDGEVYHTEKEPYLKLRLHDYHDKAFSFDITNSDEVNMFCYRMDNLDKAIDEIQSIMKNYYDQDVKYHGVCRYYSYYYDTDYSEIKFGFEVIDSSFLTFDCFKETFNLEKQSMKALRNIDIDNKLALMDERELVTPDEEIMKDINQVIREFMIDMFYQSANNFLGWRLGEIYALSKIYLNLPLNSTEQEEFIWDEILSWLYGYHPDLKAHNLSRWNF